MHAIPETGRGDTGNPPHRAANTSGQCFRVQPAPRQRSGNPLRTQRSQTGTERCASPQQATDKFNGILVDSASTHTGVHLSPESTQPFTLAGVARL